VNKIRVLTLILGTVLILALGLAACVPEPPTPEAEGRLPVDALVAAIPVGMGDLHLAESSLAIPVTGEVESAQLSVGMGDLQYLEAVQAELK